MFDLFLSHVYQKQQRTDAFVAICEGVILHDEVQKVGRFFLAGTVERLAEHGLFHGAEDGIQGVSSRIAKKGRCFIARHQVPLELSDCTQGTVTVQHAN